MDSRFIEDGEGLIVERTGIQVERVPGTVMRCEPDGSVLMIRPDGSGERRLADGRIERFAT